MIQQTIIVELVGKQLTETRAIVETGEITGFEESGMVEGEDMITLDFNGIRRMYAVQSFVGFADKAALISYLQQQIVVE